MISDIIGEPGGSQERTQSEELLFANRGNLDHSGSLRECGVNPQARGAYSSESVAVVISITSRS